MKPVKFTNAIGYEITPPEVKEPWQTAQAFDWLLDYAAKDGEKITVSKGFAFDGASTPAIPGIRVIFPRIHPMYIQAAALHDWCLKHERHRFTRAEIDNIFKEALEALNNSNARVRSMYNGVKLFGIITEGYKNYNSRLIADIHRINLSD